MSLSIGDGGLPPVYPTPPASGPSPGDEDSSPSSSGASPGDGGPDAVYEPSAPEDGEPLSYSFPSGTTSSGSGAEDGEGAEPGDVDDAEESAVDPYAEGASGEGGETAYEDYGIGGESEGDPYIDYDATEGSEGAHEQGAVGDGSDEAPVDPYADGSGDDDSVDPNATGYPDEEGNADTGEMADAAEDAAIVAGPVVAAASDQISKAAQKDVAQKEAAAAEATRPSLASALGQSHPHASLAAQLSKSASVSAELAPSVVPASAQPIYVPARFPRSTQVAAAKVGALLSPGQDAAAAIQLEAPKAKASVVAQAAYTMVGEAQRLDRSVLSLLKFG